MIRVQVAALDISGVDQPTVSGLQGIACISVDSCEAAEVQELGGFADQGWVEHLHGLAKGTPRELTDSTQMRIAAVNSSYYLAVGYTDSSGVSWETELVSASGKTKPGRSHRSERLSAGRGVSDSDRVCGRRVLRRLEREPARWAQRS